MNRATKHIRTAYPGTPERKEVLCTIAGMCRDDEMSVVCAPSWIADRMIHRPITKQRESEIRAQVKEALPKLVEHGCIIIGQLPKGRVRIELRDRMPTLRGIESERRTGTHG